jgi:hypothetical protein
MKSVLRSVQLLWRARKTRLQSLKNDDAKEVYKIKKGYVHCIRMLMFAEQIIQHGKITNWQCANDLLAVPLTAENTLSYHNHFKNLKNKYLF